MLENDLVDKIKPGDRVEVSGVFRCIGGTGAAISGTFKPTLIATGVHNLLAEKEKPNMSEHDIKNIKKLSKDEKIFDILG